MNQNIDYDNELNKRLEFRNIPSAPLQPLYDIRPISTKYTVFQTADPPTEPINQYAYDPYKIFNPGDRAPVDYYMKKIDVESRLRSQFFSIQKSSQSVFVPEFNSQLYNHPMAYSPEYFSPTDASTQNEELVSQKEFIFYNGVRSNSKK